MVTNHKVMEYYFRVSNNWNIHSAVQRKDIIVKADEYYKNIYKNHMYQINKFFNKVHGIYGNGFYSYDVIYFKNRYYKWY